MQTTIENETTNSETQPQNDVQLERSTYEIIRNRLTTQAGQLRSRLDKLNQTRKHTFGAVETQTPKDAFEARWQASVFAMVRALSAAGITKNTDQFRHAIERIDLTSQVPLTNTTDGRVTTHLPHRLNILGQQQCARTGARGSRCGFRPGVSAADHDDVIVLIHEWLIRSSGRVF